MAERPLYWFIPNVLSLKQIKKLNKFIINNHDGEEPDESKARDNNDNLKKFLTTYGIKYTKIKSYIEPILNKFIEANQDYFGFDLFKISEDSFFCNYNVYNSNSLDNYDWHIDRSDKPLTDIKLTILINLSEKEFEGGDFLLQSTNDHVAKELKNLGGAVMFVSYTRHKVTPITKGIRKNLAIFLHGPRLK